jgi:hypothetical protein
MDNIPEGFELTTIEKVMDMKRTGALNITIHDFPNLASKFSNVDTLSTNVDADSADKS